MIFTVACSLPNYLRLRLGRYTLTEERSQALSRNLQQLDQIVSVEVNFFTGSVLLIHYYEDTTKLIDLLEAIKLSELSEVAEHTWDNSTKINLEFKRDLSNAFIKRFMMKTFLPKPIGVLVTLYYASKYVWQGLKSLVQGKLNVDVLDGASVGFSVAFGHFDSASSIMFLLHVSDILSDFTRKRTRNALSGTLISTVDEVWIQDEHGVERRKCLSDVVLGDQLVVRTGSMIPIDGEVVSGIAGVNQASMTGESVPVMKSHGDRVFAGTVVAEGEIVICVTALENDSRIHQILNMVENSEQVKSLSAANAELIGDRIVPMSFLLSLAVWLITGSGHKALSALTVDYSCAIKLATPIAVISGIREAAQQQVMVKGGKYMEAMAEADTIVFDKTGTLTLATPQVVKILAFGDLSRKEVLRLAACLEEHFPHSLARAIVRCAEEEHVEHREEHAKVEYIVAHGVKSTWNDKEVLIGSEHFLVDDNQVMITDAQRSEIVQEGNGYSCVYLAIEKELVGVVCIQDPPRQEAKQVIADLKKMGIKHTIMLTGDGEAIAEHIAQELDIDRYYAQVLPEDKASKIIQIQSEGRRVIMVGDGVNDTPALAQADVSVALRDSSDIAREVADITLLSGNLNSLCHVRRISQRLMRRIELNFNKIVTINTALLALGATGVLQPTSTALYHNASTAIIGFGASRPFLTTRERENAKQILEQTDDKKILL